MKDIFQQTPQCSCGNFPGGLCENAYGCEPAPTPTLHNFSGDLAKMLADPAHRIVDEVLDELQRATKKFPQWPTDPLHALAILSEEYGELAKAMLQQAYEPHKTAPGEIRKEAIQTAAMALRLAMSLDRYNYTRSPQHFQG